MGITRARRQRLDLVNDLVEVAELRRSCLRHRRAAMARATGSRNGADGQQESESEPRARPHLASDVYPQAQVPVESCACLGTETVPLGPMWCALLPLTDGSACGVRRGSETS